MSVLVEVQNLTIRYGRLEAVSGISFSIPRGEVFGFIGPNGAGKTSTVKALATLLEPHQGEIVIDGIDTTVDPEEVRKRIGYVPDAFGLYEDLTVQEYLHFFAAAHGIQKSRRHALVHDVIELADLRVKLHQQVDSLSRGQKQRLSVARVLLHDPELLILDEPAAGLDPRARIEFRELLKELQGMGKTILLSSHYLQELGELATRVGIIDQGRMVAEGPVDEVIRGAGIPERVEVELVETGEALLERLRAIAGVAQVTQSNGKIELSLGDAAGTPDELLVAIQAAGARVRAFAPCRVDLETVFLKLTGGGAA